jgi:hypothetical protein
VLIERRACTSKFCRLPLSIMRISLQRTPNARAQTFCSFCFDLLSRASARVRFGPRTSTTPECAAPPRPRSKPSRPTAGSAQASQAAAWPPLAATATAVAAVAAAAPTAVAVAVPQALALAAGAGAAAGRATRRAGGACKESGRRRGTRAQRRNPLVRGCATRGCLLSHWPWLFVEAHVCALALPVLPCSLPCAFAFRPL